MGERKGSKLGRLGRWAADTFLQPDSVTILSRPAPLKAAPGNAAQTKPQESAAASA